MKPLVLLALVLLCGCAVLRSNTTKYDASTGEATDHTHVTVITFFDAHSDLTKFRNTTGQVGNGSNVWSYPAGTTIGGLNQEVTSTNLDQLIGIIVQSAVTGAAKAAKP